jgi:colanic acid biosynthesis glycosyl transferase WcaI
MKILIYSINSPPELVGIGKYNGEMALWLNKSGHHVKFITAYPYYPKWEVFEGYKSYAWSSDLIDNLTYIRCPIWVPSSPSGLKRIFHLLSFALSSFPSLFRQLFWRPDIIFTVEPPIFTMPAALLFAKLTGAKSILHIQDYEVDAAFNLGILQNKWLRKLILNIEAWLLGKFDYISTISEKMMERAVTKGVNASNLILFRNWVDLSFFKYIFEDGKEITDKILAYRVRLNIPQNAIVALYSGNMGVKQGLQILADTVELVNSDYTISNPIHFIFCGDGPARIDLEKKCNHLNFVHFLDLLPVDEFIILLRLADIHLLPQRADAEDLVMPSKLGGILASGRPVLACANNGSELSNILKGIGFIIPPENIGLFHKALVKLSQDSKLRHRLGVAGKKYAEKNLDKNKVLFEFEQKMLRIINEK